VVVEKVGSSEKSGKSDDEKCLGDWGKSFVELPGAKRFLRICGERVFQQPLALSQVAPLLMTMPVHSSTSDVLNRRRQESIHKSNVLCEYRLSEHAKSGPVFKAWGTPTRLRIP
jgi:hypothetical protein